VPTFEMCSVKGFEKTMLLCYNFIERFLAFHETFLATDANQCTVLSGRWNCLDSIARIKNCFELLIF